MESLEDLKAIIAGKPHDGKATHIEDDGTYISEGVDVDEAMIGGNWVDIRRLTCTRKLSDIKRIIELMEIVEDAAALGFLTPSFDSGVSHKQLCKKYDALK